MKRVNDLQVLLQWTFIVLSDLVEGQMLHQIVQGRQFFDLFDVLKHFWICDFHFLHVVNDLAFHSKDKED